ncbi:MAG TPA: thioesterase domain-containing protein [Ktedonobacteraceae bacterium]|jgi:surfactin synthase thioesterase subunit
MKNMTARIAALPQEKQAWLMQRLKEQQPTPAPVLAHGFASGEWVVRYRPNPQARLRLFCFPYAGGSAALFRSWLEGLPEQVEVCAIQLPGRETRLGEPACTRMAALMQGLLPAIMPYLDLPFAFYGHSMGALISFDLARRLRASVGRLPLCLYLAAYRAPHLPNPNIKIYHLPAEVFKVVLRADGIPDAILQNEELMQAMLPTLRADFELCDTYEYREEAPLACPFVIFGGEDDVRIRAEDLRAWPVHSSVPSRLSLLPGSHFFLHSAQEQLLAALSQDLVQRLDACAVPAEHRAGACPQNCPAGQSLA